MSAFTKPATSARGSACSQSSRLPMSGGSALITCSSRCSLLNTAADTPLWPSNTWRNGHRSSGARTHQITNPTNQRRTRHERVGGEGQYGEDGEGRGGVAGDAEAVGLDEEVVFPALGEAGVAVAQGRALGASGSELAPDQRDQGQRRRQPTPFPLCAGHRHRLFSPQSRLHLPTTAYSAPFPAEKSSGTATMARRARIRIWGWMAGENRSDGEATSWDLDALVLRGARLIISCGNGATGKMSAICRKSRVPHANIIVFLKKCKLLK